MSVQTQLRSLPRVHGGRPTSWALGAAFLLLSRLQGGRATAAEDEDDGLEGWDDLQGAGSSAYWDRVYRLQGKHGRRVYEWYGYGFEDLQSTLEGWLPPRGEDILVVGSGDSEVSSKLVAEGWRVTSIDFSHQVVEHMRRMHPGVEYLHMDARQMSFPDGKFRFALDKGLSDCVGSFSERRQYFAEVRRVLVDDGVLMVFSIRTLAVPDDLGEGWQCEKREAKMGALFYETSPKLPPMPQAGTEGSIPYYLLICRKALNDGSEGLPLEAASASGEDEDEDCPTCSAPP